MSAALYSAWLADMARLEPALAPHVFEIDGSQFLAETCPIYAAELHAKLTKIGYFHGFFNREASA